MIYTDFVSILQRSKDLNTGNNFFDGECFNLYVSQIDKYLKDYFIKKNKQKTFEILQMRALGFTLEEISQRYNVTRERIRQIINKDLFKLTNPGIVEASPELSSMYSLLCGLGESDLAPFFAYLEPTKHVLCYIIDPKRKQPKKYNINKPIKKREPLATKEEVKEALLMFIEKRQWFETLFDISTSFEREWKKNKALFSGNITWNLIMDSLLLLVEENRIIKRNNTYILND